MNKSDLKNGMTLILRDGGERYIVKNKVFSEDWRGHMVELCSDSKTWLLGFDDDLKKINRMHKHFDIMKVLDCDNNVIWERKEVDWSKIPKDTRVLVRNFENSCWYRRYFAYCNKEGLIYCYDWGADDVTHWKYVKLAEEPSDKVTIEELDNQFRMSCGRQNCCDCDYENIDRACEFLWLMDSYNVTRKE